MGVVQYWEPYQASEAAKEAKVALMAMASFLELAISV